MPDSPNRGIPYVPEGTLDPAAGLNVSIDTIDALLQTAVILMSVNDPPGAPAEGDLYIVGDTPTGAWAGEENNLARYVSDGDFWQFFQAGSQVSLVLNRDDGNLYKYDAENSPAAGWVQASGVADAPSDGDAYVRKDATWERLVDQEGLAAAIAIRDLNSPPGEVDPAETIIFGDGFTVSESEAGVALVEFEGGVSAGGIAGSSPAAARLRTTAGQAVSDGIVEWDVVDYDTHGMHDAGDNTKITIQRDGYYHIDAFVNSNANAFVTAGIRINGTDVIANTYLGAATNQARYGCSTDYFLSAGDYIEVTMFSSSGGVTQNVDGPCYFNVHELIGGSPATPVINNADANLDADINNSFQYTRFSHANPTYTFDAAVSPGYVVGAEYHGRYIGAGTLTLTEAGGFTINPPAGGSLVIPPGGTFTVKIVAADEADLSGVTDPP